MKTKEVQRSLEWSKFLADIFPIMHLCCHKNCNDHIKTLYYNAMQERQSDHYTKIVWFVICSITKYLMNGNLIPWYGNLNLQDRKIINAFIIELHQQLAIVRALLMHTLKSHEQLWSKDQCKIDYQYYMNKPTEKQR